MIKHMKVKHTPNGRTNRDIINNNIPSQVNLAKEAQAKQLRDDSLKSITKSIETLYNLVNTDSRYSALEPEFQALRTQLEHFSR